MLMWNMVLNSFIITLMADILSIYTSAYNFKYYINFYIFRTLSLIKKLLN